MINTFAHGVIRWRWLVLPVVLLAFAYAITGGRFLSFTSDYRVFFSDDNPQLVAFEALQDTYTKNDNVLFVLVPKSGNVFNQKTLASVEQLTERAWQIPFSIRVDSVTNFQHTYAEGDDLVVEDLVTNAWALNDQDLARTKQVALQEPSLLNRLISPTAHVTGVNVTIQMPGLDEQREVFQVAWFARSLADEVREANPDVDVYLTGISMMNVAFPEASMRDMQTLVPLMFAVVIVLLGVLLRTAWATLAALLVIILSIAGAMGLTGWLGIRLSPPTSAAPTIILTMAVADCVHILVNALHGMRGGLEKRQAIIESVRLNFQPIFITSVTTAIGFMSMNFSDAPPFRDLGNIVAMGVMLAFVLSVTLFPALLSVLPMKVGSARTLGGRWMACFGGFVVNYRRRLLWGMAVAAIVLIACIPRNELNDEFVKYFDESVDFRRATDFTTENLTGIYLIEYSLSGGEAGGVSDPQFLAKVEAFAQWYRQQPEVMHVSTITDTL
ncbi:MAG: MMPL family transporter, partial [Gammaproteobacteria bacterium]|nr:MMPL family transporter [Gammaproteobacteria bacterium]